MRIYSYSRRDSVPNFGDELNNWLWRELLPDLDIQDANNNYILVGIGTVLNNKLKERISEHHKAFIFSSGAGYELPLTDLPSHWKTYCVRGPLTAKLLGLSKESAITDGGILLRRFYSLPEDRSLSMPGFMPHVHHAVFAGDDWSSICDLAGIKYIDPRWPVEQVMREIQSCKLLLAEAMHGAITADAVGVPWIPIVTSPRILPFKWQDWCASIQQLYSPERLPVLNPQYPRYGRGLRSGLNSVSHWSRVLIQKNWSLSKDQHASMAESLRRIAEKGHPMLSDRTLMENLTQALEAKLNQMQEDISSLN